VLRLPDSRWSCWSLKALNLQLIVQSYSASLRVLLPLARVMKSCSKFLAIPSSPLCAGAESKLQVHWSAKTSLGTVHIISYAQRAQALEQISLSSAIACSRWHRLDQTRSTQCRLASISRALIHAQVQLSRNRTPWRGTLPVVQGQIPPLFLFSSHKTPKPQRLSTAKSLHQRADWSNF
jgi:hypothetical protein